MGLGYPLQGVGKAEGEQRKLRTTVQGKHGRAGPRSRKRSGGGGSGHPESHSKAAFQGAWGRSLNSRRGGNGSRLRVLKGLRRRPKICWGIRGTGAIMLSDLRGEPRRECCLTQRNSVGGAARDLDQILLEVKNLAKCYRQLTGRPLGVTGEIAEISAAKALGLELAAVRQSGYDAIRYMGDKIERIQIKGRCVFDRHKVQGRLGSIKLNKEWDVVLLVLLDQDMELIEIYEAKRPEISLALITPGSKARNERGALAIPKFKSIGKKVWP